MKQVLLLLIVVAFGSCATLRTTNIPEYSQVLSVKGSKSELFLKSLEWLTRYNGVSKAVIDFQDKDLGVIYGDSAYDVIYPSDLRNVHYIRNRTAFSVKIETKQDAVRVTLSSFRSLGTGQLSDLPEGPEFSDSVVRSSDLFARKLKVFLAATELFDR